MSGVDTEYLFPTSKTRNLKQESWSTERDYKQVLPPPPAPTDQWRVTSSDWVLLWPTEQITEARFDSIKLFQSTLSGSQIKAKNLQDYDGI